MFGESSKNCETNCQCSGLITESFKINSGNNGAKRKQDDSRTHNYKTKMNPHMLDFIKSPISPDYAPVKRRILGEIQISQSPLQRLKSPLNPPKLKLSPLSNTQNINSPLLNNTSPLLITRSQSNNSPLSTRPKRSRISKVMDERTRFKMANKENEPSLISETFVKLDDDEEARDFLFANKFEAARQKVTNWSSTKLDFSDSLPTPKQDSYVPQKEMIEDEDDCETLHDLEEEFDTNFDECTKYEIISTDSPNIISRGRTTSTRKVVSRNFDFGAPLAENEPSTSFNKPTVTVTRMLTFEEEGFEFTSPAVKKAAKKSLKFSETPTKLAHVASDSSIGSMNSLTENSPKTGLYTSESTTSIESGFSKSGLYTSESTTSLESTFSKSGLYISESTTSMESGFISEMEEPFLEIEESNSPKLQNFNELISGQIKSNVVSSKSFLRRPLNRSLSFNPDSRARMSLFSILENPERKNCKRVERSEVVLANKRRKSNCLSPDVNKIEKVQRPVLQRAHSENNASIMSAMERSMVIPDLIGDFSVPFALPLTSGDHSDLKSISCDTLAGLLRGEFHNTIREFQVIDCRYPYEFEGGHIKDAVNYYTPAQVQQLINKPIASSSEDNKRNILVFHCEFSIERGPKLSRFLRSSDRQQNIDRYPQLHYPEVYLLHSGYKAFYQKYPELCTPEGYTAMMDPLHRTSLKHHRTQ